MSGRIIAFFRASPPKAGGEFDERRFRSVRWQTFITMTLAYVTFYVCRLSFTVAKSALVELGITPTELGMIGSTLFFSYAIGKLVNGFIADHANVVRYMSLGLLLSAGMNLMMGMPCCWLSSGGLTAGRSRWASARAWYRWRAGTAVKNEAPFTPSGRRRITSAKR